jgi:hypothetical protein
MTDADLAVRITALKQAVSKAKAAIEQRRQEADALSKEMAARAEHPFMDLTPCSRVCSPQLHTRHRSSRFPRLPSPTSVI